MRTYAFSRRTESELDAQIDYLISRSAFRSAEQLADRTEGFLSDFLAAYPRTGRRIPQRDLWEIWIPGTRLVLWYRFTDTSLDVVRIWHASQKRDADPIA
jgi:plasmid stabilization system protein ParE